VAVYRKQKLQKIERGVAGRTGLARDWLFVVYA